MAGLEELSGQDVISFLNPIQDESEQILAIKRELQDAQNESSFENGGQPTYFETRESALNGDNFDNLYDISDDNPFLKVPDDVVTSTKRRPLKDSSQRGSAPISKATKTSVPTYSLVAEKKIDKHEVFLKKYPVTPYLGDLDPDSITPTFRQLQTQFDFTRLGVKTNKKTIELLRDKEENHFLAVFPQDQTYLKIGKLKLAGNLFKKHPTNDNLFFEPTLGGVFARISDNIHECNAVARLYEDEYLDFYAIKNITMGEEIVVFSEIQHVDGFVTNHIDQDDLKKIIHGILKVALGTPVEDTPYAQNNFSNYKEDTSGYKENYRATVFERIYESELQSTQVQIKVESTSKVATADFITTAIGYLFI